MFSKPKPSLTEKGLKPESLARSQLERAKFTSNPIYEKQPGRIPQSILIADRVGMTKNRDISLKRIWRGSAGYQKEKGQNIREKYPGLEKTGMVTQGRKGSDSLSTFPQNIGQIVVETFSKPGDLIYDPHAGHNSRMELVYKMGRSYIGVDPSKEFMIDNRKIMDALLSESKCSLAPRKNTIKLIEGSSHCVKLKSEIADFSLTSPPYWNVEYYGDEPEQLGNIKTYDGFIERLYLHIKECYRILKKGSFCCYFINDLRIKGKFYPFHIDCYNLHCRAGFKPDNIYIVDLGWPINAAFHNDIVRNKKFPKRHEYCLVFKKPRKESKCR